jgi:hypothetical protein
MKAPARSAPGSAETGIDLAEAGRTVREEADGDRPPQYRRVGNPGGFRRAIMRVDGAEFMTHGMMGKGPEKTVLEQTLEGI